MNTTRNIGPFVVTMLSIGFLIVLTAVGLFGQYIHFFFDLLKLGYMPILEGIDNYFSEDIMHQVYLLIAFAIVGLYIAYKRFVSKYKEAE